LFFPSFFPQFLVPNADWSLNGQFLLLATTFALLFVGGMASMALLSHRLSRALQRPARMHAMNRVTGGCWSGWARSWPVGTEGSGGRVGDCAGVARRSPNLRRGTGRAA
jgi:hypothetical protein